MVKAIYLDRDGTLNDDLYGYVHKVKDFKLLFGVVEGLRSLSKEFIFVVVTNQSGIGRKIYTEGDMEKFNEKLIEELKKENIEIKKIYFCRHTPEDNCNCRKPSIKYIKQAEKEFDIDLKNSWVIGDHPSDIEMGIKSGCRNVYMLTGHGKKHLEDLEKKDFNPNFVAENFLQAAKFIIKNTTYQYIN